MFRKRGSCWLPSETQSALAQYRIEQSRECLEDSKRSLRDGSFKTAANRSYYCIFHAMRAVLALDSFDSKKHSGIIAFFRQRYIKTGIFQPELSDMIQNAYRNRGKSDYEDFFVISKEETTEQIENAKTFLAAVEAHIKAILLKSMDSGKYITTESVSDARATEL